MGQSEVRLSFHFSSSFVWSFLILIVSQIYEQTNGQTYLSTPTKSGSPTFSSKNSAINLPLPHLAPSSCCASLSAILGKALRSVRVTHIWQPHWHRCWMSLVSNLEYFWWAILSFEYFSSSHWLRFGWVGIRCKILTTRSLGGPPGPNF